MPARPLTPRQQRFVEEYLVDLCASAAYQRAGYRARGNAAEVNAARLLRNAQVAEAIAAARKAQGERTGVTADRVVEELALVAFSDIRDLFDPKTDRFRKLAEIPERAARALASMRVSRKVAKDGGEIEVVQFRLWDKLGALDSLARHLGMFDDKLRLTGTGKDGAIKYEGDRGLTPEDLVAAIALAREAGLLMAQQDEEADPS